MALVEAWTRTDPEKKSLFADYFVVSCHAVTAALAVVIGIAAGSIALAGFGFASMVQAVVTGMRGRRNQLRARGILTTEKQKNAERRTLFILGIVFFLLSLSLLNESGSRLFYKEKPETSVAGIVLSVLSFTALSVAAIFRFRLAHFLQREPLRAAARDSVLWCCLSVVLFLGLWLHQVRGWWWADPIASLCMLPFLMREGWNAVEESKDTARQAKRGK